MSSMKTRLAAATAGVALLGGVAACGSSGGGTSTGPSGMASMSGMGSMSGMPMGSSSEASGTATIDVKNFAFSPMNLTVTKGTKVTWKFEDSAQHTVKANDGSFSSPALSGGKTYSFTFDKVGTYPYICSIHQYMTATITVK
jgi:plastocyanin